MATKSTARAPLTDAALFEAIKGLRHVTVKDEATAEDIGPYFRYPQVLSDNSFIIGCIDKFLLQHFAPWRFKDVGGESTPVPRSACAARCVTLALQAVTWRRPCRSSC